MGKLFWWRMGSGFPASSFSWSRGSRGSRPHLELRAPVHPVSSKEGSPSPPHLPPLPPSWNRLYRLHAWHSSCVGGTSLFTAAPTVHRAPKAQRRRSLDPWSIPTYTRLRGLGVLTSRHDLTWKSPTRSVDGLLVKGSEVPVEQDVSNNVSLPFLS